MLSDAKIMIFYSKIDFYAGKVTLSFIHSSYLGRRQKMQSIMKKNKYYHRFLHIPTGVNGQQQ